MAIISFWNKLNEETGKASSLVALATYMAFMNNYRVLIVSTKFNDSTIKDCFVGEQNTQFISDLMGNKTDLSTGIEGLVRAVTSNKTSPDIITNYTKVIYKDRLEVLLSPETQDYQEYLKTTSTYKDILTLANKHYDLIFVDIENDMQTYKYSKDILDISNLIIYTFTQKNKMLKQVAEYKNEEDSYLKQNNILYMIGRCDMGSKYNPKNVARYLGLRKDVLAIPHCTLFAEATGEVGVAEYFVKFNKINDDTDQNYIFIQALAKANEDIIYKLQELQMKY